MSMPPIIYGAYQSFWTLTANPHLLADETIRLLSLKYRRSPEQIFEESGFQARALKLAAVHDYRKAGHPPRALHHVYKMYFICEITGGVATPSNETSEVAFFARDALPPMSLGRTLPAQVERMFEHWQNPERPADFD